MPDPAEQASLGIRLETALAGLLAHLKRQEDALQEVSASTAQDGSGLLSADLSRYISLQAKCTPPKVLMLQRLVTDAIPVTIK